MINISTNRHVKHMINPNYRWLTPGCYRSPLVARDQLPSGFLFPLLELNLKCLALLLRQVVVLNIVAVLGVDHELVLIFTGHTRRWWFLLPQWSRQNMLTQIWSTHECASMRRSQSILTSEASCRPVRPAAPNGQTGWSRDAAKTENRELGRDPVGACRSRVVLKSAGHSRHPRSP